MTLETKAKNWWETLHDSEKGLESEDYMDLKVLTAMIIDRYLHTYSRDNSLTKQDAIEAMELDYKVTHRMFSDDEWIKQHGLIIFTEDNYQIRAEEFWQDRNHPNFDKDWAVFY